jgi:hypothetical protein
MSLSDKLKKSGVRSPKKRTTPLWDGPCSDTPNGGITFSLLSRFLVCRERFRLLVVEGLKSNEGFNHRLEYGNMLHLCEETYLGGAKDWQSELSKYAIFLVKSYPLQTNEIEKWYNVCKVQFPIYVEYWSKHKDTINGTPLLQEYTFKVPYKLNDRRTVFLRGKWDSVDLVSPGKKQKPHIILQENKTKGDVDEQQLKRQLSYDLQVMLYLVALDWQTKNPLIGGSHMEVFIGRPQVKGVRYNVIRRPLSGGKGSIVKHKPTKSNPEGETFDEYYERLRVIISEAPQEYFFRWNVEITPDDIEKFKLECLDPILHQLCDWWEWVSFIHERGGSVWDNDVSFGARPDQDDCGIHNSAIHWRHPYGCYNPLLEGMNTEMDNYLADGSTVGLQTIDKLFGELN